MAACGSCASSRTGDGTDPADRCRRARKLPLRSCSSARCDSSRSLRRTSTLRTLFGSRRQTVRNGGWISSRTNVRSDSGTIRPVSGSSRRLSMRMTIPLAIRSPTAGTPWSACQPQMACRSVIADSARRMAALWIKLLDAELRLGSGQVHLPAGLQVRQASDHGTHEGPLLLCRLIVDERFKHGHAASAARYKHRSVFVRRTLDFPAGIGLQGGEGDRIRGKHRSQSIAPQWAARWSDNGILRGLPAGRRVRYRDRRLQPILVGCPRRSSPCHGRKPLRRGTVGTKVHVPLSRQRRTPDLALPPCRIRQLWATALNKTSPFAVRRGMFV